MCLTVYLNKVIIDSFNRSLHNITLELLEINTISRKIVYFLKIRNPSYYVCLTWMFIMKLAFSYIVSLFQSTVRHVPGYWPPENVCDFMLQNKAL